MKSEKFRQVTHQRTRDRANEIYIWWVATCYRSIKAPDGSGVVSGLNVFHLTIFSIKTVYLVTDILESTWNFHAYVQVTNRQRDRKIRIGFGRTRYSLRVC